jgi:two-component system, NtrC family, sensor kinase
LQNKKLKVDNFKHKSLVFLIILFFNLPSFCKAQFREDSLRNVVSLNKRDTTEVNALNNLSLISNHFDTAIMFAQSGLDLAEKLNYRKGVADGYFAMSSAFGKQRNYFQMIRYANKALSVFEAIHNDEGIMHATTNLGIMYFYTGDFNKGKELNMVCIKILEKNPRIATSYPGILYGLKWAPIIYSAVGELYLRTNQQDSALYFALKAVDQNGYVGNALWNYPVYVLASVYSRLGKYNESLQMYRAAFPLALGNNLDWDTLQILSGMANLYLQLKKPDSSIYFARQVNQSPNPNREAIPWLESIRALKTGYKLIGNKDSALKYAELEKTLADSLFGKEQSLNIQTFLLNEKFQQEEIKTVQEKLKRKIQGYIALAGVFILLLIGFLLWRSNQQKQKAKEKIEKAYAELKSAQAQLIQSEKMASLGELTAGIAHEIQNPLNFVNNFSDINDELLSEMHHELQSGHTDEALRIGTALGENNAKIGFHGKRADAIVKSMLEHSRASKGEKQATDLNALIEEYLRLSYHGYRAKNKTFGATLHTTYDAHIPAIPIVPQEFGRVLLNLFNNAFYAVQERAKSLEGNYEPTIWVSSKRLPDNVAIEVKDNGMGISKSLQDKIFQPFFTTKPAGQGTGLGLSLSYDIIKAHGGDLQVQSEEGQYTAFTIHLPYQHN